MWKRILVAISVVAIVLVTRHIVRRHHDGRADHSGTSPGENIKYSDLKARLARSREQRQTPSPSPWRVVTAAELDERGAKWIACVEENKCPEGTHCHPDRDGRLRCYSSNCLSLSDITTCGNGKMCMQFYEHVYRCVPEGQARSGEPCNEFYPAPKQFTCAAGLACWHGKCRSTCRSSNGCVGHERCLSVSSKDSICVDPACTKNSECQPGRACVRTSEDDTEMSCVPLGHMTNGESSCSPNSCPSGQACDGMIASGEFIGRCRSTCSEVPHRPCPSGQICGMAGMFTGGVSDHPGLCYAACSLETMKCATPGEVCATVTEDMTWSKAGCILQPQLSMPGPEEGDDVFTDPVANPRD